MLREIVSTVLILLSLSAFAYAQQSMKIDFSSEPYLCAVNFTPHTKEVLSYNTQYHWDFGDGGVSHERAPVHQYKNNGRYNVTLTIVMDSGVSFSRSKQIRYVAEKKLSFRNRSVEIIKDKCENVIEAEMYTYVDQPLGKHPVVVPGLVENHIGVWKRGSAFKYAAQREEGVYSVPAFHGEAELAWHDGWRKKTTQIFNDSVISVPNAAVLWDKSRSFVIAECVNAAHEEVAYTGFEEQSLTSGNWVFSSEVLHMNHSLPLISGYKNVAVVELSSVKAKEVTVVEVNAESLKDGHHRRLLVPVLCQQPYEKNENWTALVLGAMPHEGLWMGEVLMPFTVQQSVSGVGLDNDVRHSGNASLRVERSASIGQPLLNLKEGKDYVVSAWLSTAVSRKRNTSVGKCGIELSFLDGKGQLIQSNLLTPSGAVIEGWQRVSGTFSVPDKFSEFKIKIFGSDITWVDDIRLFPSDGNMRTYVHDVTHRKPSVVLDENNLATFFYYSDDGELFQEKKETDGGVKTIKENIRYSKVNH